MEYEKEDHKITDYVDVDHAFIDGRQFISIERFIAVKSDQYKELTILNDEVRRLKNENDAYRTLLHKMLDEER